MSTLRPIFRPLSVLRAVAEVLFRGVVVSLDTPSGPLRFATDSYEQRSSRDLRSWQANVRAVTLGLEALRAVDRHGITHRAEQYQGWRAIEPAASTSMAEAQAVIDSYGGEAAALRATHPDHGGSREDFERVQQARTILREVPR